jgi:hypothetical protein
VQEKEVDILMIERCHDGGYKAPSSALYTLLPVQLPSGVSYSKCAHLSCMSSFSVSNISKDDCMFRPRPLCPKFENTVCILSLQPWGHSCLNEPKDLRAAFMFHFIILKFREVLQAYSDVYAFDSSISSNDCDKQPERSSPISDLLIC